MKILLLVSNFPNKCNLVSGIFYKRTVDELIKKGIEVTIITPKPWFHATNGKIFFNNSRQVQKLDPIENNSLLYIPKYLPFPNFPLYKIKELLIKQCVLRCIRKHKIKFDLIDSRYAYPWSFLGLKISQYYNKPSVSVFIGSDINHDIYRSRFVWKRVKAITEQSTLVSVSTAIKNIVEHEFGTSNVKVIFDGLDFSKLDALIRTPTDKQLFPNNKLTIGYVGDLSVSKGCATIIEIIKITKLKYNWLIIGDGKLFKSFKKFTNVNLTGLIKPEEVLNYYISMDIVLFISYEEGIPNVLKEAANCQIPIIASTVGGIPELTNNGSLATLIDDYKSPYRVIEAIEAFEADKLSFQEKAVKLKKYVSEQFNLEHTTTKLIETYHEVLKNHI